MIRKGTDNTKWGSGPMAAALAEADAAVGHDDVPVGAVVVRDGVAIAARHNERELTGDPTAHAEILALRDAAAAVGSWRLDDCTMYVTLEPCAMCAGALVNARMGTLVYATDDPKAGAVDSHFGITGGAPLNHRVIVERYPPDDPAAVAAAELLRAFFRSRRST